MASFQNTTLDTVLRDIATEKAGGLYKTPQVATADLRSLCAKTGFQLLGNEKYQALHAEGKKLVDFIVVHYDSANKYAVVPFELVDMTNPKLYAAIVCYTQGSVQDVLLLPMSALKSGMFAMTKKVGNELRVNIAKVKAQEKYSFGVAIKELS